MRSLALAILATAAAPALSQTFIPVTVVNPTDDSRTDEVVEIPWRELTNRLPDLGTPRVRVVGLSGAEMVSQTLDLDGDGTPEHLLVLVSLWPTETRTFRVEALPPLATVAPRVHVLHDDYRDDMAWESDRIAWRTYGRGLWDADEFDPLVSSGIDVWLKRTHALITEDWYEKGHDAYHIDSGEGADFYSVGATLGAGGTGVWNEGSVSRAENFADWRILADGPIRAVFEMDYAAFDVGGRTVSERKRITIDAGRHLFRQESTYDADVVAVVGLVDRPEGVVSISRPGLQWTWFSMWGPVERKNGGHGDLGTAVLVPAGRVETIRREGRHDLALMPVSGHEPVLSYVGAGWTASEDIETVQDWWALLDREVSRLSHPLRVTIGG